MTHAITQRKFIPKAQAHIAFSFRLFALCKPEPIVFNVITSAAADIATDIKADMIAVIFSPP